MNDSRGLVFWLSWFFGCAGVFVLGVVFGIEPILFPLPLVLFLPPLIVHVRAYSHLRNRIETEHPAVLAKLRRDRSGLMLKTFIFSGQSLDDPEIVRLRRLVNRWLFISIATVPLIVMSFLLIERLSAN